MTRRRLLAAVGAAGFGLGAAVGWLSARPAGRVTSTTRLSPDETLRAWVSPHQWRWDESPRRHIGKGPKAGIDRVATGEQVALLVDGYNDVGGPLGTERFVWSRDGSKLLLVGRHFWVRDDLFLDTGDQAYLLHDLKLGKSWVNAQTGVAPPLTADLVAGVEWAEPVVLKPRAKVDPESFDKPE